MQIVVKSVAFEDDIIYGLWYEPGDDVDFWFLVSGALRKIGDNGTVLVESSGVPFDIDRQCLVERKVGTAPCLRAPPAPTVGVADHELANMHEALELEGSARRVVEVGLSVDSTAWRGVSYHASRSAKEVAEVVFSVDSTLWRGFLDQSVAFDWGDLFFDDVASGFGKPVESKSIACASMDCDGNTNKEDLVTEKWKARPPPEPVHERLGLL